MKELLPVKTALCLILALLARTTLAAMPHGSNDSIRQYYNVINKAELAIVDSNFKKAIELYNQAFQLKKPNALDLHNAYCATAQVKDCKNGKIFIGKLANMGYGVQNNLLHNPHFWNCTAKGMSQIAEKATIEFLASTIGKKLDSLARADQAPREMEKPDMEQVAKVDNEIRLTLYNLLKTEEFTKVERGIAYGNAGNEHSVVWLVRWHQRGMPSILDSILLANVMKGDYNPGVYASLTSVDDNTRYGIYYNENRKWTDEERKTINKNRERIYLESLEDYEKKIGMQLKTEALIKREYLQYGDVAFWNAIYFKLTPGTFQAPVQ